MEANEVRLFDIAERACSLGSSSAFLTEDYVKVCRHL